MIDAMAKVSEESRWGCVLGVMQSDCDKAIVMLRETLRDISDRMERYKRECEENGIDYANDAVYRRYRQLYGQIGGIYYCMQGCGGILSGLITDMLSDVSV